MEHVKAFVGHAQEIKTTFGYTNPLNVKLFWGVLGIYELCFGI